MDNWIVALWVVVFVTVPVVALVLARRSRMQRHAVSTSSTHRPHGHHREGH